MSGVAKLNIRFPDGSLKTTTVAAYTTLQEILFAVGAPADLIAHNNGDTSMLNPNYTMVDYNNWYPDKDGFLPELHLRTADIGIVLKK